MRTIESRMKTWFELDEESGSVYIRQEDSHGEASVIVVRIVDIPLFIENLKAEAESAE